MILTHIKKPCKTMCVPTSKSHSDNDLRLLVYRSTRCNSTSSLEDSATGHLPCLSGRVRNIERDGHYPRRPYSAWLRSNLRSCDFKYFKIRWVRNLMTTNTIYGPCKKIADDGSYPPPAPWWRQKSESVPAWKSREKWFYLTDFQIGHS